MAHSRKALLSFATVLGAGLLLSGCHWGPGYQGAYRPHYPYGYAGYSPKAYKYKYDGPRYRYGDHDHGRRKYRDHHH